jgi:hypothetical protein
VAYPTDAARYADNAADLVEFRIKPTRDAIVYRATLNTVKADDAAIVGIGIDTDRRDRAPRGRTGRASPLPASTASSPPGARAAASSAATPRPGSSSRPHRSGRATSRSTAAGTR